MKDEPGATANGEPTGAQLEAHGLARVTADRARITDLLALHSVTIDAAMLTAISDGTTAPQYAYAQALAEKANKSAAATAEDRAKQAWIDGQKQNEKTLAEAGIKVPSAPAVEPKPDAPAAATAEKKSRLTAAMQRTGVAKLPTSA